MKRAFAFFLTLALVPKVFAQDPIVAGRPVAADLSAGAPRSYAIALNAADYVSASLVQRGRVNVVIYAPDGRLLRRFPAPPADGSRPMAFVAEEAGTYRLELASPAGQVASYELQVGAVVPLENRLQPDAEVRSSPRIDALGRGIAAGNTDTSAFWKQIAAEGTPLVEPLGSDGKYDLVTFLWRGGVDTRNVYVFGSMRIPYLGPSDFTMRHLERSDVWYLTVKMPAGARFSYRISPNDPLVSDGPRADQRAATAQADPLNRHVWDCRPNSSKYACASAAELPGAVPQPWLVAKPGVPQGRLESRTIASGILKMDRALNVYTPSGYRVGGPPTSLLVLFDGDAYLDMAAPVTFDNLIAASKIPPTTVVFVATGGAWRLQDLVANDPFADFVAKELVPWVRQNYSVTRDPSRTAVGGYSAGGLAAAYVGRRHSAVFGNVLSQSGAFWWEPKMGVTGDPELDAIPEANGIARLYAETSKLPLKFYLDAGTFEIGNVGSFGILEANRHLRDVLRAKGYSVAFQQFIGGHDGLSWRGTVADGLIALLGRAHD